jgi:hypothetical protein
LFQKKNGKNYETENECEDMKEMVIKNFTGTEIKSENKADGGLLGGEDGGCAFFRNGGHCVTTQKPATAIFTAVRTSNLRQKIKTLKRGTQK